MSRNLRSPTLIEPVSHWLLFWLLAGMGVATVVPCLLVPPMDALRTLEQAEAAQEAQLAALQREVGRNREFSRQLRGDPLANLRLAQREMGQPAGGEVRFVEHRPAAPLHAHPGPVPPPVDSLPPWIRGLYPQRWAALYQTPWSRRAVFLMALTTIVCAVALYGPKPVIHRKRNT